MSATSSAPPERASRSRLPWIVVLPAVPALGLGYQFCAEKVAMATAGAPAGLPWLIKVFAQPWTGLLVVLEIASFAAWMTALSRLPVSIAFPLTAISYALVIALGWFVFHEPVRILELVGAVAIMAGVFMVGGGRGGE